MKGKSVEKESHYGSGVIVGIFIGIALFMITYWLLLLAK